MPFVLPTWLCCFLGNKRIFLRRNVLSFIFLWCGVSLEAILDLVFFLAARNLLTVVSFRNRRVLHEIVTGCLRNSLCDWLITNALTPEDDENQEFEGTVGLYIVAGNRAEEWRWEWWRNGHRLTLVEDSKQVHLVVESRSWRPVSQIWILDKTKNDCEGRTRVLEWHVFSSIFHCLILTYLSEQQKWASFIFWIIFYKQQCSFIWFYGGIWFGIWQNK